MLILMLMRAWGGISQSAAAREKVDLCKMNANIIKQEGSSHF